MFWVLFEGKYLQKITICPFIYLKIWFSNSKTSKQTPTCLIADERRRNRLSIDLLRMETSPFLESQKAPEAGKKINGDLQIRNYLHIHEFRAGLAHPNSHLASAANQNACSPCQSGVKSVDLDTKLTAQISLHKVRQ